MTGSKRVVTIILVPRRGSDDPALLKVVVEQLESAGASVQLSGPVEAAQVSYSIDTSLENAVGDAASRALDKRNAIAPTQRRPDMEVEVENARGVIA